MKKTPVLFMILLIVSLAACKQATTGTMDKSADGKGATESTDAAKSTGDMAGNAAVDSVSKEISNVDSVEKDLNPDQLDDLDSGFTEVRNS